MAELKRVINKKFILFVAILLAFNMYVYIKEQYEYAGSYISEADENITSKEAFDMYVRRFNEVMQLEKADNEPEISEDETIEARMWNSAVYYFDRQKTYMAEYAAKYDRMLETAQSMADISIFSQKQSFNQRNIEKTVGDFEETKDIELKIGNDKWITSVTQFKLYDYCIIMIIVYLVMQYCVEGKSSLMYFVHSTPNGRIRLTLNRVIILLLSCIFMTAVFYPGTFALSGIMYDVGFDLSRPVQSIEIFQECPIIVNIGQFILLCAVMRIAAFFMLGLLFWTVFSILKKDRISIIVTIFLLAAEYYAYYFIDSKSSINYFKYINIFNYINSQDVAGGYVNLNIFSHPVNVYQSFAWIMASVIIILLSVCIYKGAYVYGGTNRLMNKLMSVSDKVRYVISARFDRTNMFFGELKKLLFDMGGILIIVIAGYILYMQVDTKPLYRSEESKLIQSYYEKLGERYSPGMDTEIEMIIMDLQNKYRMLTGGDYTGESGDVYNKRIMSLQNNIEAAEIVKNQVLYLKELYEEENVSGYLVEQLGARYLFGRPMKEVNFYHGILISLVIAIFSGGVYAHEKKSNMLKSINSMPNGRIYFKLSKFVWCAVFTTIFIVLMSVIEFTNIQSKLGIEGLNIPVSSFMMFKGSGIINITLFQFFVICTFLRCIFGCAGVIISLNISKRVNKPIYGQILSILVLTVPGILYYLNIKIVKPAAMVRWYSVNDILTDNEVWSGELYSSIMIAIVILVLGFAVYLKKEK